MPEAPTVGYQLLAATPMYGLLACLPMFVGLQLGVRAQRRASLPLFQYAVLVALLSGLNLIARALPGGR
ncbi:MAG TPA: hypothetical protein VFE37_17220 [Chloroflexota bacterium]|nr:hypothetical protein [Chloroflexota bacterium]